MNKIKRKNILIIGRVPPPIGGVTIHVQRLLDNLKHKKEEFYFVELNKKCLLKAPILLLKHKKIHLHSSNPLIRLYFTILSKLLFVKSIVTFHGDIGRFNGFFNLIDKVTIKLCTRPLVLNSSSLQIGEKLNKNTKLVSAFIPPVKIKNLCSEVYDSINKLKKRVSFVYCTNASNVSYDKNKREIYQISTLVDIFKKQTNKGLIVSDSSGKYYQMLQDKIKGFDNILFLSYPHDFNAVILESNFMIRYTTTDGDSLSVKEALHLKKTVIASNVVSRPSGVILVDLNYDDLVNIISTLKPKIVEPIVENTIQQLTDIYNRY